MRPHTITSKDKEIIAVIKEYHLKHGYMPSFREIGKAVGLTSTSTVKAHMDRLRDLGEIETDLDISPIPSRGFRLRSSV